MAYRSVLIVRNDRLGDWVLTLPLVAAIKAAWPEVRLGAMARPQVAPLLARVAAVPEVIATAEPGWRGWREAARRVRAGRYDAAVVVHPDLRDSLVVWAAGVRVRVGNGFRGYAVFYNRRVFFHRSPSDRHEVEYNLLYLKGLGIAAAQAAPPRLAVSAAERARAATILSARGAVGDGYVVVHPGSGGSSLNWPRERYRALAAELARATGLTVVVTGAAAEAALAGYVAGEGAGRVSVAGETDLGTLLAVLAGARLFISGNTGPMHLAAAVGTPTVSLFAPLRSGSPRRWGPRGNVSRVLVPAAFSCDKCVGAACEHYNCMAAITVEEVLGAARRLLAQE